MISNEEINKILEGLEAKGYEPNVTPEEIIEAMKTAQYQAKYPNDKFSSFTELTKKAIAEIDKFKMNLVAIASSTSDFQENAHQASDNLQILFNRLHAIDEEIKQSHKNTLKLGQETREMLNELSEQLK